jgi:hypothetical protein
MPKKPVAVSLRKPQAPADVDRFVGGQSAAPPVRATPPDPVAGATDVQHGARDYREMTFYLPSEVARQLAFYCMDRGCDANRVVADAVSTHVGGLASQPAASGPSGSVALLEAVLEHLRGKLSAIWARPGR